MRWRVGEAAVVREFDAAALRRADDLIGQRIAVLVRGRERAGVGDVLVRFHLHVRADRRGVLFAHELELQRLHCAESGVRDGAVGEGTVGLFGTGRAELDLAQRGHGQHVACAQDAIPIAECPRGRRGHGV